VSVPPQYDNGASTQPLVEISPRDLISGNDRGGTSLELGRAKRQKVCRVEVTRQVEAVLIEISPSTSFHEASSPLRVQPLSRLAAA